MLNPRYQAAIYDPTVTVSTVVNSETAQDTLTWTANPSIASYGGLLWAVFDGNDAGTTEGAAGQSIWLKTSADGGTTWTTAVKPFTDATYCNNVVSSSAVQWQPNLVAVGTELWCLWNNGSGYISKLTSASGKWTNYRFEYGTGVSPVMSSTVNGAASGSNTLLGAWDGETNWAMWPATQPIVLWDGVVACPVTFLSATVDPNSPVASPTFYRQKKQNRVLYIAADGTACTLSEHIPMSVTNVLGFSEWEPFVVEAADRTLYVFSRNNRTSMANADAMWMAKSTNRYAFTVAASTQVEVASSRGSAGKLSAARWGMVQCDYAENDTTDDTTLVTTPVRRNLTMFVSRTGGDDFAAGVGLYGSTINQIYPQFCVVAGTAYVVFTEDRNNRRSLRLSKFAVPASDAVAYVHPRKNSLFLGAAPILVTAETPNYYDFNGTQQATWSGTAFVPTSLSMAAWVYWSGNSGSGHGLIVDDRTSSATAGTTLQVAAPSLLGLSFTHGLTIPVDTPFFMAATFDAPNRVVSFWYGDSAASLTQLDFNVRSVAVGTIPSDGDTITVDGTAYTFRTSATLGTEIAIGATNATATTNLVAKLAANGFTAAAITSTRAAFYKTDRSAFTVTTSSGGRITVDSALPLLAGNTGPRFGFKTVAGSSLVGLTGRIYEAKVYAKTISAADAIGLYNSKAVALGYATIAGSTDPGTPDILFDPAATVGNFSDLNAPVATYNVSGTTLRLYGETSAAVEIPYEKTAIQIPFRLGALPSGTDKYCVCTIGTKSNVFRVFFTVTNPTRALLNGSNVTSFDDPTRWSFLNVVVTKSFIYVAGTAIAYTGTPRVYLGQAYPEGLLASTKYTEVDVSNVVVAEAKSYV